MRKPPNCRGLTDIGFCRNTETDIHKAVTSLCTYCLTNALNMIYFTQWPELREGGR